MWDGEGEGEEGEIVVGVGGVVGGEGEEGVGGVVGKKGRVVLVGRKGEGGEMMGEEGVLGEKLGGE